MEFENAKNYITNRLRNELPVHLTYHTLAHVMDVYQAAERIAKSEGVSGKDLQLLLIASLYHDSGFIIESKDHEDLSCSIAQNTLPAFAFSKPQVEKICGMIQATHLPQQPNNLLEEIMADADLDYLGRSDFWTVGKGLYEELKYQQLVKDENEWNHLQIKFLEQHHYFTATADRTRSALKATHLQAVRELIRPL